MLATKSGKGSAVSYQFEPGPRYCVTGMKGVEQIDIEFTEIGADGNPIDGRVKERRLHSWDVPSLNNRFAIAKDLGGGKYGQGRRAGAILKKLIDAEITKKKANPTPEARGHARRAARPPPPPPAKLPPRRPAAPAPAPAPASTKKRKPAAKTQKPAAKKKKPAAKKPAAKAPPKPSSTKRPAPPRRKPAAKKRAGREAPTMNCKKRDRHRDDFADRLIRYDWMIDEFGDDYDATDYEYHELTPEHTYMTYNDLDTLLGYMDSQNRVLCKEVGDGHCALAGPERMRLWHADELESAWQPLNHNEENELEKKDDWYVPVRNYLADTLQEGSVMFKSIYETVKMLHGNGIVDDTLDAHQLYDDLKRISPSVASTEAMRDKAEFEYYCGAWELMALVGRVPGRIFVIYKGSLGDCDCFQKDGDGVEVTREIDIRDAELDNTDTVLLYNGEDHYDSFVPYEGVVMGEEEEA